MGVDEKALGQRLATARRQAGLTQQDLCQKAGLSYSTLAKIERGAIKSPSVFTVAAIAAATATSLEDILGIKSAAPAPPAKKTSKTGIRFVYFDIGDVLIRYHHVFTEVSKATQVPIDIIETLFYRYNDTVCRGGMSLAELNKVFTKELGLKKFDWADFYFKAAESVPEAEELVRWTAEHYEVGLLSNMMPGYIDKLMARRLLPKVPYKTIVDSSRVGAIKPEPAIFKKAQQMAGVEASAILFVDDSRTNLTIADRLGWRILAFDDYHPAESARRVRDSLVF